MENDCSNIIYVDGILGAYKSTLIDILSEKYKNYKFYEQGILSHLSNKHWGDWENPKELNRVWLHYVILECEIPIAIQRNNSNFSSNSLFLSRYRMRNIAAFYGSIHLIDTTRLEMPPLVDIISDIIEKNSNFYIVPCMNNFTSEKFLSLPFIIEGESKIVREFNHRFHILKYKPTVYSHKMQRAGEVPESDKERMIMTKNILDIFSRHEIQHSYWFVGDDFILNEKLSNDNDIPPLEVIVKRCFVGSDKHRYYNMENLNNRFGQKVVKTPLSEYQKLLVRFDYRNPNFHPETNLPLGDILLCDDLADEFINVSIAKITAKNVFQCLDLHFSKMDIYFEDVCLMLTVQGDKLYGEVSQDCGRYKYFKENALSDLDKDVWRAGGSSELVLQKYRMLSKIISQYVKTVLYV